MPARYLDLGNAAAQIFRGFTALRNIKMYTLYSAALWQSDAHFSTFTQHYEPIIKSESVPAVIYYTISE
jgi:hypothetical protein